MVEVIKEKLVEKPVIQFKEVEKIIEKIVYKNTSEISNAVKENKVEHKDAQVQTIEVPIEVVKVMVPEIQIVEKAVIEIGEVEKIVYRDPVQVDDEIHPQVEILKNEMTDEMK